MDKLSVLVDSFDGYSDVWKYFFQTFNKFWGDCPYPVYLVSNKKDFSGVNTIKTGKEKNFVYRTIKALESIDTPFVMIFLEDYFLSKNIDNEKLENALSFMEESNADYLRLIGIPSSRRKSKNGYTCIYANEPYGVNLQVSVWKTEYLLKVLKELKNGSPWDFEIYFLNKTVNAKKVSLDGCYYLKGNPFSVHGTILRGKYFRKEVKFYSNLGINIDLKERGKLSLFDEFKYNVKLFFRKVLPKPIKKVFKKIFIKCGVKFASEV